MTTPSNGKIGSATTMFVERPAALKPVPAVDELGVKHATPSYGRRFGGGGRVASDIPAPAGKPLTHVR